MYAGREGTVSVGGVGIASLLSACSHLNTHTHTHIHACCIYIGKRECKGKYTCNPNFRPFDSLAFLLNKLLFGTNTVVSSSPASYNQHPPTTNKEQRIRTSSSPNDNLSLLPLVFFPSAGRFRRRIAGTTGASRSIDSVAEVTSWTSSSSSE